jgi:hypothetical protein
MRGWHEIAGTSGSFVDCLRDGQIATRTGGTVRRHSSIEDAALRIARDAGLRIVTADA